MKIAVLDRQKEERSRTTALIYACRYKSNPVEVSEFGDYCEIVDVFGVKGFDCLFITVDNMDDFESAWRLHDIDHHCPIILISDSGEYALTSYRIQVAHYLTKPISKEKINEALRRIKNWRDFL